MPDFYLILLIVFFVVILASFLVGKGIYNVLEKKGSKHSKGWAIFAAALIFLLITGLLLYSHRPEFYFIFLFAGTVAYLMGRRTYNVLAQKKVKHPKGWTIFASVLTFVVMSGLLSFFVLNFIYLGR